MQQRSVLRFAPALVPLLVGAAACWLVFHYELEPMTASFPSRPFTWARPQRDALLGILCATGAVGILAYALLRKTRLFERRWLRGLCVGLLVLMCSVGGLAYFYGARGERQTYVHVHDSYHYLVGAKYFPELGYDGLYACTLLAMPPRFFPDSTNMRNLTTDRSLKVKDFRGKDAPCRARFTEERWAEFQHDLTQYGNASKAALRGSLRDRGYNGSPIHTFMAMHVANWIPLDYGALSLVSLYDVVGLTLMLAFVAYAFGPRVGLVFVLFFFVQFCDRHVFIGNSFLRYIWMVALGCSLAAMKLRKYTLSGVFMAIAAALNVFPVVFAGALAVKVAVDLIKRRGIAREHKRFLTGAIAAGVVCLALGAAHSNGVGNYTQFREAMKTHNVAFRLQNFGVGLKYDFVFRGEVDKETYNRGKKIKEFKMLKPVFVAVAILLIALSAAIALRLDDVEGAVLVGFTALFCFFGPSTYYYACAAVLILLWHRRAWDTGGAVMLALLFGLTCIPWHELQQHRWEAFLFNTLASFVFSVYVLAMLGYLGTKTRFYADAWRVVRRKKTPALEATVEEAPSEAPSRPEAEFGSV